MFKTCDIFSFCVCVSVRVRACHAHACVRVCLCMRVGVCAITGLPALAARGRWAITKPG